MAEYDAGAVAESRRDDGTFVGIARRLIEAILSRDGAITENEFVRIGYYHWSAVCQLAKQLDAILAATPTDAPVEGAVELSADEIKAAMAADTSDCGVVRQAYGRLLAPTDADVEAVALALMTTFAGPGGGIENLWERMARAALAALRARREAV